MVRNRMSSSTNGFVGFCCWDPLAMTKLGGFTEFRD